MMWKIVRVSEASVIYIYIYIYRLDNIIYVELEAKNTFIHNSLSN